MRTVSSLVTEKLYQQLAERSNATITFNSHSQLKLNTANDAGDAFICLLASPDPRPDEANTSFAEVMRALSRVDYRDRFLHLLRGSHRASVFEWSNFGLVLPFGAPNEHFNWANKWLFLDGRLQVNDSASPLRGWK